MTTCCTFQRTYSCKVVTMLLRSISRVRANFIYLLFFCSIYNISSASIMKTHGKSVILAIMGDSQHLSSKIFKKKSYCFQFYIKSYFIMITVLFLSFPIYPLIFFRRSSSFPFSVVMIWRASLLLMFVFSALAQSPASSPEAVAPSWALCCLHLPITPCRAQKPPNAAIMRAPL